MSRLIFLFLSTLSLFWGCSFFRSQPPTVVFISDLGSKTDRIAAMKGVMWGIRSDIRIDDSR